MKACGSLFAAGLLLAAPLSAQVSPVGRVDLAFLNPDTARTIHIAYDLGAGADFGNHVTVLVDVVRRDLAGNIQGYGSSWETLVGGVFEYVFGDWQEQYRRRFTLGLRAGALQPKGVIRGAPYLGLTLGFRYPVIANLRVDGHLEDVFAFPSSQHITACDGYGDCFPVHVGGRVEQNFGLFLGVEVHP